MIMGGEKYRRVLCTLHRSGDNGLFKRDWSRYDKLRYVVGQLEVGEETCKTHWQFYMEFREGVSLKHIKEVVGDDSVHIEKCNGTAEQCKAYVTKEQTSVKGTRFEYGTMGGSQGKRTDLEKIKDDIMNGDANVNDILLSDPITYHQYGRTMEKIQGLRNRSVHRTWMTKGTWICGPTGTGKSERAFEGYSPDTHYILNTNDNGWWDGYTGQEVVIIDDFRGSIPYAELLRLVDKYPMTVKQRHRAPVPFLAKHVIITSSMDPTGVYSNLAKEDKLEQLTRRFEIVRTEVAKKGNTMADATFLAEGTLCIQCDEFVI